MEIYCILIVFLNVSKYFSAVSPCSFLRLMRGCRSVVKKEKREEDKGRREGRENGKRKRAKSKRKDPPRAERASLAVEDGRGVPVEVHQRLLEGVAGHREQVVEERDLSFFLREFISSLER